MKLRRLRTRLMLAYMALIVIGFSALAALAGGQIAQGALEDFARSLEGQALIVAQSLREEVEHFLKGEAPAEEVGRRAAALAAQAGARLSLIDARGVVWFDSAGMAGGANVQNAPEVAAALARRVTSDVRPDAYGASTLYAAAPVLEDGEVLAVVVLARPVTAANASVRQRWWVLGSGVLLLGLLSLGASVWLAASLTRPLEQLRTAALRLAAGDFSQRVPETRRDELGQVA
ncbi:MAG TPA: HAMP domain-containing protein, partial [Caldilineaceae bacterium]|nr:HAMP domain-containing protein [Caldilineaceae bacterium]